MSQEIIVENSIDQRQIQEELRVANSEYQGNIPILGVDDEVYFFQNQKKI